MAEVSSTGEVSSRVPLYRRAWARIRYGLLWNELFGRLSYLGLHFVPYYIVVERPTAADRRPLPAGFSVRELEKDDIPAIERMPHLDILIEYIVERFERGAGAVGIFRGQELVAYTWYYREYIPTMETEEALYPLREDEAYLFDMYVSPQYRGRRLAGLLRQRAVELLAEQGVIRYFSISAAYNRPSRRFKARLGAEEIELRLYVRLGDLWRHESALRRTATGQDLLAARAIDNKAG